MDGRSGRVCPVKRAGSLDNRIRRWLHDPRKILGPYIGEGMTVLDVGCGPGLFTIEMAQMVGESGRVIAVDLQEEMLDKLRNKTHGTALAERIKLHKCEADSIGISDKVDFALAFYMVHEVPNQQEFFEEVQSILKPDGLALVVEPPLHVSNRAFEESIGKARDAGLTPVERPRVLLSKTILLKRAPDE
ncbi:MAG: class I SAM-dependent methyltransferase [Phycisphaerales bacterium]|nr:MAG: class I SAM-dependent methyltransferase [Phycisphaerales bacterium]